MKQRRRRLIASLILLFLTAVVLSIHPDNYVLEPATEPADGPTIESEAVTVLDAIPIKGRAPKTDYSRAQFGDGWASIDGCDMRNIILARDLEDIDVRECKVFAGTLDDPYTGKTITFVRGATTSDDVQIDHVVALSNAWQTGAAYWSREKRVTFANDPLELLAVDGSANEEKSDGDAATWLPPNKPFRCQYVARQVAIKAKYELWMTQAEHDTIARILSRCPGQTIPSPAR